MSRLTVAYPLKPVHFRNNRLSLNKKKRKNPSPLVFSIENGDNPEDPIECSSEELGFPLTQADCIQIKREEIVQEENSSSSSSSNKKPRKEEKDKSVEYIKCLVCSTVPTHMVFQVNMRGRKEEEEKERDIYICITCLYKELSTAQKEGKLLFHEQKDKDEEEREKIELHSYVPSFIKRISNVKDHDSNCYCDKCKGSIYWVSSLYSVPSTIYFYLLEEVYRRKEIRKENIQTFECPTCKKELFFPSRERSLFKILKHLRDECEQKKKEELKKEENEEKEECKTCDKLFSKEELEYHTYLHRSSNRLQEWEKQIKNKTFVPEEEELMKHTFEEILEKLILLEEKNKEIPKWKF